ncbi:MAG: hypothetical protein WD069_13830 [Planctomycetales bacterium]
MPPAPAASAAPRPAETNRPLLSYTSILILSGFLAGLASARLVPPFMEPFLFGGAAAGLASWIGLGCLAERRRRETARQAVHTALHRMDRRLDRHIPRQSAVRMNHAPARERNIHRQYLAVVGSDARFYNR